MVLDVYNEIIRQIGKRGIMENVLTLFEKQTADWFADTLGSLLPYRRKAGLSSRREAMR